MQKKMIPGGVNDLACILIYEYIRAKGKGNFVHITVTELNIKLRLCLTECTIRSKLKRLMDAGHIVKNKVNSHIAEFKCQNKNKEDN